MVPVCLQAKKANPGDDGLVSIKRVNDSDKVGNHQLINLAKLAKKDINCGYIFYNVDEREPLYAPVLPIVKDIKHMAETDSRLSTSLHEHSIDLATYVAHVLGMGKRVPRSSDGLKQVADALVAGKVEHIIALSADPELGRYLSLAFGLTGEVASVKAVDLSSGPVNFQAAFSSASAYAQLYPPSPPDEPTYEPQR